ncbi:MAG: protein translocase subunit SecF [Clostridia bacterium]|nr:protein translocase subunit SecF [Clostridia bacterium]MDD4666195.1 protein translocase subunit SecF [Clostridia bacterium]
MMDFIGKRKIWYALSLIVILVAIGSLFMQGLNFGIDFRGGTLLQLKFEKAGITGTEIRAALEEFGLEKSSLQQSEDSFIIKTAELSREKQADVLQTLESKIGKFTLLRSESVGPVIGDELRRVGLLALVIAAVLQIIYITIRFEFRFGIAAILALMHDAIITVGFFSLFQYEVDLTFIAAILTVIGYSINDTIVIFDRIRENLKLMRKEELAALVNKSIKQNLVRSINTSLSVAFVLVALLVLGGETTRYFSLAMLVGVIAGVYSSIFIASALWYDFVPAVKGQKKPVKI